MSARRTTRRTMLAASAGALAGSLIRPSALLAAAADPPAPQLAERWLGRLGPAATTVELARPADLVGVEWRGPAHAHVQLRVRAPGGRWSRWASAAAHGHFAESEHGEARVVGDPVWTGGVSELQLRSPSALGGVRLHLVDVSGGVGARRRASRSALLARPLPLAAPMLDAGPGQPPVIARRAWARGGAPPAVAPAYGAVRMAFVHHTENPNGYGPGEVPAMLLAIYVFHRRVRGWNDIGYNFVVDLYGRIFEARAGGIDEPVVGAQAGGYNLLSTGVAVLGSFMSVPISPAARGALERLLAWKLALHGVPAEGRARVRVDPAGAAFARFPGGARVMLPRIAGHRDGDATDCPGNALYGELPALRAGARRLAPRPVQATIALGAGGSAPASGPAVPPAAAQTPPPGAPAEPPPVLGGTLAFLDRTPIAGARVLVQARTVARAGELVSERTLAEAVTDARGAWSLPATFAPPAAGRLWLRALCPGSAGAYGAAVSEPLSLRLKGPSATTVHGPSAPAAAPRAR